jgi:hypothetical protein
MRRSVEQNKRLWAMLEAVSLQMPWAGKQRSPEAWKDIFTAAFRSAKHELDVVPGINGGFVLLGMHTSSMTVGEMSDLFVLIEEFCARNDIQLQDDPQEIAA